MLFKTLSVLSLFIATALYAGDSGHGGDAYVADFIRTANAAHEWISKNPSSISAPEFSVALGSAKIESTENELSIDGRRVDAINYPASKRIVFNRKAWEKMASHNLRWTLVIHEILSLMGKDDANYQISGAIVKSAIPSASVEAERMFGILPWCGQFISYMNDPNPPQPGYGHVNFYLVPQSKGSSLYRLQYLVTEWIAFKNYVRHEETLIENLTCEYSHVYAGLMRCNNSDKEEFLLNSTLKYEWGFSGVSKDETFSIKSKKLAALYQSNQYLVSGNHALEGRNFSYDQWLRIAKGAIPFLKSKMTMEEGEFLTKLGSKAIVEDGLGKYSMQVGSCEFYYPSEK